MPLPTPPLKPLALTVALTLPVVATAGGYDHRNKEPELMLEMAAMYQTFEFDEGAAEIVDYDPKTKRLFVVNGEAKTIDVLSTAPVKPDKAVEALELVQQIELRDDKLWGDGFAAGGANSVAVKNGIIAAAVEADDAEKPGRVILFDRRLKKICDATVGALPDMVTFTPDGKTILVANEGEPDNGVDPEGSISIVDLRCRVRTADFHAFDGKEDWLRAKGVRLFPDVGSKITVSQDLEPEYIAVSPDGKTAVATLQEANALAVVDIRRAKIKRIVPLGLKNHSKRGNGLDPSDRDNGINIRNWPVYGLYMPDAIDSYSVKGETFYIIANEGDDRGDADGDERGDAIRFKDIEDVESFGRDGLKVSARLQKYLDRVAPDADEDENLGRVNISSIDGLDGNGDLERLHVYGGRSFSIWGPRGLVYDSGDDLEQLTASLLPNDFNATNDENDSFENRSDNKGPEPEAVEIGRIGHEYYAFIGLERIGGVAIYNVSNPYRPKRVLYVNSRNFAAKNGEDGNLKEAVQAPEGETGPAGDLGPEGIKFIPAHESPEYGTPMIAVANEISGTTTLFRIRVTKGHHGKGHGWDKDRDWDRGRHWDRDDRER